jgi:hypothetical protein
MHHEEQQQQHHMVPMQHAYLQQYGNQHTIVKVRSSWVKLRLSTFYVPQIKGL